MRRDPEQLYKEVKAIDFGPEHQIRDLGEGMAVLEELEYGYWKPRILIDETSQKAYGFMNRFNQLVTVRNQDINWLSLARLPKKILQRALNRDGEYPTVISRFSDGTATVMWLLNPDGRYYADEDGFGMTSDTEIELLGSIDRTGRVVRKFRYEP